MTYIILSCSLNQSSFGDKIGEYIAKKHSDFELISIKGCDLGLCDGFDGNAFDNPKVLALQKKLEASSGVILIAPIYNFDVAPSCQNLLDLLSKPYKDILSGKSLYHKTIGFIGTCYFSNCYLAPLHFLTKIMLVHEAFIVPKHVMAKRDDPEIKYARCVDKLVESFLQMSLALQDVDAHLAPSSDSQ